MENSYARIIEMNLRQKVEEQFRKEVSVAST
jgi:hypothetical protein